MKKKLEFIIHDDRRIWIRLNGKILYEGTQRTYSVIDWLADNWRKLGKSRTVAREVYDSCTANNQIRVSHPQFVRPIEYA